MQSIQDWVRGRPVGTPGRFSVFSLGLFVFLCVGAVAELGRWPLFAFLLVLDVLGTLAAIDFIVSIDRTLFFLVTLLLTLFTFPLNIFLLSLEVLGLVASLDFSFLLRRVDGTGVDKSVLIGRLKSYAYTIIPAFLLTYLFLYLYSVNPQFTLLEATLALGLGSVGVFVSVYAMIRFLLSLDRRL